MQTQFTIDLQPKAYTDINSVGIMWKETTHKLSEQPTFQSTWIETIKQNKDTQHQLFYPLYGYDMKPMHTPVSCTGQKKNHNVAATITNRIGWYLTNYHFYTEWWYGNLESKKTSQAIINKTDLTNYNPIFE